MSPRYCRQLGATDCGPIAILNALKWAGLKVSLRTHLPYLKNFCASAEFGTPLHRFNALVLKLKKNRFIARYRKRPTLRDLEQHLRAGGSALLYYFNGRNYHFALVIGVNPNGSHFTMVNEVQGRTVSKVTRKTVKKFLTIGAPAMWLLSKVHRGNHGSSQRRVHVPFQR